MPAHTAGPPAKSAMGRAASLLLVLVALALVFWLLRGRVPFQWDTLWQQFSQVTWWRIALGSLAIYVCYWLRAARWSVLLAPVCKTRAFDLLPAQVIGFTGVAILGRVADLSRPYIIARRTETPITTQIAIYSIERAFDLGAAATLFSVALAFAPPSLPHHEAFVKTGMLSVVATVALAAIAAAVRFRGGQLAHLLQRLLAPLAPRLAQAAAARVLDLQQGFGAVSTFTEFASAMALSLLMWLGIASCYLLTATAFRGTPTLAHFSFSATMLVLATGIGGAVIQLPVLGWFTQIAIFATTLHALFSVPVETATACAALILFTTNLVIIPAGLITAQVQGIGLRDTARAPEVA